MTSGRQVSRVNGQRFSDTPPSSDGQYLRSAGGVWVPSGILVGDIPNLTALYQPLDVDLTAIAALSTPAVDSLLVKTPGNAWAIRAYNQSSQQIIYGSSTAGTVTNQNITIPSWASQGRYRYRIMGCGAGSQSGIMQPTTTTAASGGATGGAGFYLERSGLVSELSALGSIIAVSIGAIGVGGLGVTAQTANLGTGGGDTTLTIGATVIARATGGQAVTAANGGGSNGSKIGGTAGMGGVSSSTIGNLGNGSNQLDVAASGGTGGGITTGNIAGTGGSGNRGGTISRTVTEALSTGGANTGGNGANAVEILVMGLPVPGNSPGGGGASITGNGGNGGNGINGSSGGGGGSCRSGTSGAGGNGGRGYLIMEFFE